MGFKYQVRADLYDRIDLLLQPEVVKMEAVMILCGDGVNREFLNIETTVCCDDWW